MGSVAQTKKSVPTISGLTTTRAKFIEDAQKVGKLFIQQPYELYSEENHQTWEKLFTRMKSKWENFGNPHFLDGIHSLCLDPARVPRLEDVNKFLEPLTGFQALPVSGYVPAFLFFDCLRNRKFPTTITVRSADSLDYLPEPDIFHDIAGHVPMHTDKAFADALVRFGDCAHTAAKIVLEITDHELRLKTLHSIIQAMARFFWFTIEFGLMKTGNQMKVYGSGLLSSFSEIEHSVTSSSVQRFPAQLEWMINQSFEIDRFQNLLFYVDSFDHLFSLVDQLESWMLLGKLNSVAPGQPEINDADLQSFLESGV